jgi:hypothetical protein
MVEKLKRSIIEAVAYILMYEVLLPCRQAYSLLPKTAKLTPSSFAARSARSPAVVGTEAFQDI